MHLTLYSKVRLYSVPGTIQTSEGCLTTTVSSSTSNSVSNKLVDMSGSSVASIDIVTYTVSAAAGLFSLLFVHVVALVCTVLVY